MKKVITLSIEEEIVDIIKEEADKEHRSISNFIVNTILLRLKDRIKVKIHE
jgi:uncharacterized protein (DUF1778 family)